MKPTYFRPWPTGRDLAQVVLFILCVGILFGFCASRAFAKNTNQSVIDHHYLANLLTYDDHTQYFHVDGRRNVTKLISSNDITSTFDTYVGRNLYVGGVLQTGGSLFFGTEHDNATGRHTNINATGFIRAASGLLGDTLNITTSISQIPNGNGVGLSAGVLVAEIGAGLTFSGGNIVPDWGSATPATINDETGTAGAATTVSRSDHRHPVVYAGTAEVADVSGTAEAAGSSPKFARGDHVHLHPVLTTGDHHTEYIKHSGTRAFTGNQSMGGFQLTAHRLEQATNLVAYTPATGTRGRLVFDSDVYNTPAFDDGVTLQYLRSTFPGNGLTATDDRGQRRLDIGAGTGISVGLDDVGIDTSVVPRKNVANTWTEQQTISSHIVPLNDNTSTLGTGAKLFNNVFTHNISGPAGSVVQVGGARYYLFASCIASGGGLDIGSQDESSPGGQPFGRAYIGDYYGAGNNLPARFPAGIKSTGGALHQQGTSLLAGSITSLAVTLATAMPTSAYKIVLTPDADTRVWWTSKATTGFTINLSSNAGTTLVDWDVEPVNN